MSSRNVRLRSFLISGFSLAIFCVIWEIIANANIIPNFPGSLQTFGELKWWISDPFFDNGPNDLGIGFNLLISLRRVLIGYTLAMVVAIPVGLFVGVSKTVKSSIDPYVQLLKPVSPLAWLPIGLFVFRNSEITGIFVIFITSI